MIYDDLPVKNGDFPVRHVEFPEGKWLLDNKCL